MHIDFEEADIDNDGAISHSVFISFVDFLRITSVKSRSCGVGEERQSKSCLHMLLSHFPKFYNQCPKNLHINKRVKYIGAKSVTRSHLLT